MVMVPRIAAVSCLSTMPLLYGVQHADNLRAELLSSDPEEVLRKFLDREADFALLPAGMALATPEAKVVSTFCVGAEESAVDTLILSDDPLLDQWRAVGAPMPAVLAVWVAHEGYDPEAVEALDEASTFGLEHTYEAVLSATENEAEAIAIYEKLSSYDYIFDADKRRALEKFWDSGLKVAPRANPG